MAAQIKDMTRGKPAKLLITFAIPLMLGNVFQQLYTVADTMIVGRALGVNALASLGSAGWLNWLVLGIIMGFANGFSILVSQTFGAGDRRGLHKAVTMTIVLLMGMSVVLTVLSLALTRPILELLNTPADIIEGAATYLYICFAGIVIVAGYNTFSAILRAMGDSRTPLIAMVIAAIINVVLDILFVMGFHWGIAGAAVATVIGQLFSCLYCLWALCRIPVLNITKEDWKLDRDCIIKLFRLGLPMAFQNGIIAGGGLVVQWAINRYGVIFVAGYTATDKLYGILELAATSFGFSVATFAGQNLGAENYKRIRRGTHAGAKMAVLTSLVITAVMLIFGKYFVMMFIAEGTENAAEASQIAITYLRVMCSFLSILYLLHIYRSALQGMGDTVIPMISGMVEMVMRVGCVLILPEFLGRNGIFGAEVSAWTGAAILLIIAYYVRVRKLPHTDRNNGENPVLEAQPASDEAPL